jgi:hypothetical protein
VEGRRCRLPLPLLLLLLSLWLWFVPWLVIAVVAQL